MSANERRRRMLEELTAVAYEILMEGPLAGVSCTLLTFDYGKRGHVAYSTAMELRPLATIVRGLLARWARNDTSSSVATDHTQAVSAELLTATGDTLRDTLPAGIGYALLVGRDFVTGYISSGSRRDMVKVLTDLVARWELGERSQGEQPS